MNEIFDFLNFPLLKRVAVIFIAIYFIILLAIIADFFAGWRKAKQLGIARTSYGMKHTVNKVNRYFGMLFVLSCVDLICFLIDIWGEIIHIASVPYFTALGAIFLCIIELRSIYEKADKKHQGNVIETAKFISKIIKSREDAEAMQAALEAYLNKEKKNETKNTEGDKKQQSS